MIYPKEESYGEINRKNLFFIKVYFFRRRMVCILLGRLVIVNKVQMK